MSGGPASATASSSPSANVTVASFVPLVVAVAGAPHHMVRTMAARSLAAVVPVSGLPAVVAMLLAAIPTDDVMNLPFAKPQLGREPAEFAVVPTVKLNALDGALQQLVWCYMVARVAFVCSCIWCLVRL